LPRAPVAPAISSAGACVEGMGRAAAWST